MSATATEKPEHAVHLHGVTFRWPSAGSFEIRIRDFQLERGGKLLLLGPSGSGKSTLLSLVSGIVTPASGSIEVLGKDLATMRSTQRDRYRAEHFGIIFQMFNLLPYGSVIDNVLLPLSFAPARRQKAERAGGARAQAQRLLLALGLPEAEFDRPAANLSVGQQQRVAAARALIGAPEIIIADEPTSALDDDRQQDFLDLLFEQAASVNASLIMVSHDRRLAAQFERVENLRDIVDQGGAKKASPVQAEAAL